MNAQVRENELSAGSVSVISQIREKMDLLHKCQRKLELAALDPDDVSLLEAAHEQLTMEINRLYWRIGL